MVQTLSVGIKEPICGEDQITTCLKMIWISYDWVSDNGIVIDLFCDRFIYNPKIYFKLVKKVSSHKLPMKFIHKKFGEFIKESSGGKETPLFTVREVIQYDGYVINIDLMDGTSLFPEEDTGGEGASLEIRNSDGSLFNSTEIKSGDKIKFEYYESHIGKDVDLYMGISSVYIDAYDTNENSGWFFAEVGAMGGNDGTYLVHEKLTNKWLTK